jgi:hypothetical protein
VRKTQTLEVCLYEASVVFSEIFPPFCVVLTKVFLKDGIQGRFCEISRRLADMFVFPDVGGTVEEGVQECFPIERQALIVRINDQFWHLDVASVVFKLCNLEVPTEPLLVVKVALSNHSGQSVFDQAVAPNGVGNIPCESLGEAFSRSLCQIELATCCPRGLKLPEADVDIVVVVFISMVNFPICLPFHFQAWQARASKVALRHCTEGA